jgi:RNA polymerase sigma-70 factor (ECF subfamily)
MEDVHGRPAAGTDLADRLSRDVDAVFPELVGSFRQAVYTTALRMSGRQADAADLAAEVFLRAYQALRTYPPERIRELQLRPWLITIALNLWRNQARTASRRPSQVSLDSSPEPRAPHGGPEEHLRRRELRTAVAGLLTELPDAQRLAVVLRHVLDLPYTEIAAVLGCPEGTAKSHVSRGLQRLRALTTGTDLVEELT